MHLCLYGYGLTSLTHYWLVTSESYVSHIGTNFWPIFVFYFYMYINFFIVLPVLYCKSPCYIGGHLWAGKFFVGWAPSKCCVIAFLNLSYQSHVCALKIIQYCRYACTYDSVQPFTSAKQRLIAFERRSFYKTLVVYWSWLHWPGLVLSRLIC